MEGKKVTYFLNYSKESMKCICPVDGVELFEKKEIAAGDTIEIKPWDLLIAEEK